MWLLNGKHQQVFNGHKYQALQAVVSAATADRLTDCLVCLAGLLAYTVRRRTVEDVKKMIAPAENPASAVSRVSNTMHGRKAGEDDGDDDLLVSNTVISLKDPLSGTRIQTAARSPAHLHHTLLESQLALPHSG